MKIELICIFCKGKRFFLRSSSHRLGWKEDELMRTFRSKDYECRKCGNQISIENNEWRKPRRISKSYRKVKKGLIKLRKCSP